MTPPATTPAAPRAAAIRTVVCDVIGQAVVDADAGGIIVLDDWTPEGELVHAWLVDVLGEGRVWRGASVASNVHGVSGADAQMLGAWRAARERAGLIAHPASKTVLLLGGTLPRADLFPLGDLYASQVDALAGGVSLPDPLAALVQRVGGIAQVDAALARLVDGRAPDGSAPGDPGESAREVARLYERGRWHRLHPRLAPKLSARTLGVDLFD